MAKRGGISGVYSQFKEFLNEMNGSEFYAFFENAVKSSPVNVKLYEKYVERRIDFTWLEAIENAIIPLDTIIRDPRRFIKREEDVVPIEMARDIGPESVRHLSQHTNMIVSVEKDNVIPGRILNIVKEESFDTYENRFIYTLLNQIQYFLDKRMAIFMRGSKMDDRFEYEIDGGCEVGKEKLNYHLNMSYSTPHQEIGDTKLINADISTLDPLERVERVRKILYSFQSSQFYKSMTGTPPVRPPLVMTNVLKKNPNFAEAVKLWGFISTYNELGYSVEYIERFRNPSKEDTHEMFSIIMLNYVMMKAQTKRVEDTADYSERRQELLPNVIKRSVEEMCETFDLTIDEVRKVYEKEFKRDDAKKAAILSNTRAVFERAITFEKLKIDNYKKAEKEKLAEILRLSYSDACGELDGIRAEAARIAEEEERRKAEEEARKLAEELERLNAIIEAKRKAEEEERLRLEEEAKRKAELEAAIEAKIRLEKELAARAEEEKLKAKILENSRKRSGNVKVDKKKYSSMSRKKKKQKQKKDGVYGKKTVSKSSKNEGDQE